MSVRKGVLAVIFRPEKGKRLFLILMKRQPWVGWELPKGGLRQNEEETEGLLREIEEGTGLADVEIAGRVPYEITYSYPKDKQFRGYDSASQSVFVVKLNSGDVRVSSEHSAFKWCTFEETLRLLKHGQQRKALEEAVKFLNQ